MTTETPDPAGDSRVSGAGVVVVVFALVVGFALLGLGYGNHSSQVDGGSSSASTAVAPNATSTTTTMVGNPPATVKVKVVNATTTTGLATRTRDLLLSRGYTQVSIGDSQTLQQKTTIFYVDGSEADALDVAKVLGLDPSAVGPMPQPSPADLSGATVLVMTGLDI